MSMTIIRTIADMADLESTEMEPLFYTIDPELIDEMGRGGPAISGDIMFDYHGYRVTVTSDRQITIHPLSDDDIDQDDSPSAD